MEIRRTLRPGQPGTRKYAEQYGESLVCIRYRYDAEHNLRFTTVELIVDERPWNKAEDAIPSSVSDENRQSLIDSELTEISQNQLLSLRIGFDETELRKKVKDAGGKWNNDNKVWELAYHKAAELGLLDRIIRKDNDRV